MLGATLARRMLRLPVNHAVVPQPCKSDMLQTETRVRPRVPEVCADGVVFKLSSAIEMPLHRIGILMQRKDGCTQFARMNVEHLRLVARFFNNAADALEQLQFRQHTKRGS